MEINKSNLPYKQYYCEENIYKFCEYCNNDDVTVVFVSNEHQKVPFWCQKSCNDDGFVIWDYHVFAVLNSRVYDFDTILDFPTPFETYFDRAIKFDDNLKPEYRRKFRLIQSQEYLRNFSSDRSHMLDSRTGLYTQEPPPWPPIVSGEKINNLPNFRHMTSHDDNDIDKISIVLDTRQFYEYFMHKE